MPCCTSHREESTGGKPQGNSLSKVNYEMKTFKVSMMPRGAFTS